MESQKEDEVKMFQTKLRDAAAIRSINYQGESEHHWSIGKIGQIYGVKMNKSRQRKEVRPKKCIDHSREWMVVKIIKLQKKLFISS